MLVHTASCHFFGQHYVSVISRSCAEQKELLRSRLNSSEQLLCLAELLGITASVTESCLCSSPPHISRGLTGSYVVLTMQKPGYLLRVLKVTTSVLLKRFFHFSFSRLSSPLFGFCYSDFCLSILLMKILLLLYLLLLLLSPEGFPLAQQGVPTCHSIMSSWNHRMLWTGTLKVI